MPASDNERLNAPDEPYLSVVVTARNDDHGGNLLRRMQIFADALINQAKRHHLPSELILVEWNTPQDRERLATAIRWPRDTGPCQVRIIEVPPEVHARYRHAAALPLYQMIAKNVGIRRARGEFILATNIDIVFSDELMEFVAARRLEQGRMYRMDRTDVMSDVPVDGTLDEQLAYCRSHLIRLFAREGAFPLTDEGLRRNEDVDITRPGSGIQFGSGWHPVERGRTGTYRWMAGEAEILVEAPAGGAVLSLDVEVGPGVDPAHAALQMLGFDGSKVAEWTVKGRMTLELVLPPAPNPGRQMIRLKVPDGGRPVLDDPRRLDFRVFQCDWGASNIRAAAPVSTFAGFQRARPTLARLAAGWRKSHGVASLLVNGPGILSRAARLLKKCQTDIFEAGTEVRLGAAWHGLEGSSTEKFRWVSREAELAIRIGEKRSLALIVEPGPGVGFKPFDLVIRYPDGKVIARAPVNGMTYLEVPLPAPSGRMVTIVLGAEGRQMATQADQRVLSFRVFACGEGRAATLPVESNVPESWTALIAAQSPGDFEMLAEWRRPMTEMGRPPMLHTNACGDFTLMSREHWFDVRGYAELDQFSMHLDSMLCYTAHYAGAREEVLREPLRIYHIEHGIGSGWTPEGQAQLNARIARAGIQSLSYADVVWFINQMRSLGAALIFNMDNWGLAELKLSEIHPSTTAYATRIGR